MWMRRGSVFSDLLASPKEMGIWMVCDGYCLDLWYAVMGLQNGVEKESVSIMMTALLGADRGTGQFTALALSGAGRGHHGSI